MNDIIFSPTALKQYMSWQVEDKAVLLRINTLIKDICRNGLMSGLGKPEILKGRKAYSRRIDEKNRLVYTSDEKQNLKIISCKGHYEN
jgi:toxin YoeB